MSEFEEYPEVSNNLIPDFNQILHQKNLLSSNPSGFDPHKLMVQKKQQESGESIDTSNIQKWPEKDVKALEDFCKMYGVVGFNSGRMHPIAALALLKDKLGVGNSMPIGYEKLGTMHRYETAMNEQKQLLKG